MTVARKLSAEDRQDILDLFARYSWGIDLADKALVITCFHEDAYFDHLWQGRVQGHAAILKNLEELWYDRQHWWYGRQHLFNHFLWDPVTTPEGEEACKVRSFFQILQFNVEYRTNFVFGIGTRDDVLARIGGRWVFKSLRVNAWTEMEQVPWKAELLLKPRPKAPLPESPPSEGPNPVPGAPK